MTARELRPLHSLAKALGVHTRYKDGLGRHVTVAPETLVRVCAAVGAAISQPADAVDALRRHRLARRKQVLPPVLVAWDGIMPPLEIGDAVARSAELCLADGSVVPLPGPQDARRAPIPLGYHRLTVDAPGRLETCTVIAAPMQAWRRPGTHRSWGVGAHLAACRSSRSRSMGDLRDQEALCRWVHWRGGDLDTVLPLLPTFNQQPAEPSPYSPVSRLFWSELILDLGDAHHPSTSPSTLDV